MTKLANLVAMTNHVDVMILALKHLGSRKRVKNCLSKWLETTGSLITVTLQYSSVLTTGHMHV